MITRSLFYISLKIYNETQFVVGASAFPVALTQKFEKCQLAGEKYKLCSKFTNAHSDAMLELVNFVGGAK